MLCPECNQPYPPGRKYCLECYKKRVHAKAEQIAAAYRKTGAVPPPVTDPENVRAPRVESLPANTHLIKPKPKDFGVTWDEVRSRVHERGRKGWALMNAWPNWICYVLMSLFWPVLVPLMLLSDLFDKLFSRKDSPVEQFLAARETFNREKAERKLAVEHEKAERELERRRIQASHWQGLSGAEFERELKDVFAKAGYEAELTRSIGDAGIDIWLERDGRTTIVQCKRHEQPIGVGVARELYGVLMHEGADEAIIASVSGFTQGVADFVQVKNIKLLDLKDILKMQDQYGSP